MFVLQTQSSISSTNNGLSGTYPCCLYLVTSQNMERGISLIPSHCSTSANQITESSCLPELSWARWRPLWQSQLFRAAFCKFHVLPWLFPSLVAHPCSPRVSSTAGTCGLCMQYVTLNLLSKHRPLQIPPHKHKASDSGVRSGWGK